MLSLWHMTGQAAPYNPPADRSPVLPLVLSVFLLGLLVGFTLLILRSRRSGGRPIPAGPEPRCGKCGYAVTALTTFRCPECGEDLRVAGIIPAIKADDVRTSADPKPTRPSTKTVTIMLTDMQDYTARVAQSSREQAMRPLRLQREIVNTVAQRRGGRVIKSTGDGFIVSFDSATDALLAAREVQSAVAARNLESFSETERFQLRIAVSTGEVAFIDDDVFGHPINVASRVQQLTEPGDICFHRLNLSRDESERDRMRANRGCRGQRDRRKDQSVSLRGRDMKRPVPRAPCPVPKNSIRGVCRRQGIARATLLLKTRLASPFLIILPRG